MDYFSEYILQEEALNKVEEGCLYYPCCVEDYREPLKLFSPLISEFWFVDPQFFLRRSMEMISGIFSRGGGPYELLKTRITGSETVKYRWLPNPNNPDRNYKSIEPCSLTEDYLHLETGKKVTIHYLRAYPYEVFLEINQISVFFYRYNSLRNNTTLINAIGWLTTGEGPRRELGGQFLKLLDKLTNNGLIVTDGMGDCQKNNPYYELTKFYGNKSISREKAFSKAHSFIDEFGRTFRCIGYTHQTDGSPTLIWQIAKSSPIP
jgi:hypothetical protein